MRLTIEASRHDRHNHPLTCPFLPVHGLRVEASPGSATR